MTKCGNGFDKHKPLFYKSTEPIQISESHLPNNYRDLWLNITLTGPLCSSRFHLFLTHGNYDLSMQRRFKMKAKSVQNLRISHFRIFLQERLIGFNIFTQDNKSFVPIIYIIYGMQLRTRGKICLSFTSPPVSYWEPIRRFIDQTVTQGHCSQRF